MANMDIIVSPPQDHSRFIVTYFYDYIFKIFVFYVNMFITLHHLFIHVMLVASRTKL